MYVSLTLGPQIYQDEAVQVHCTSLINTDRFYQMYSSIAYLHIAGLPREKAEIAKAAQIQSS